jgi:hypothetical protein
LIQSLAEESEWSFNLVDRKRELAATLLVALIVYVAIPYPLWTFLDAKPDVSGFGAMILYQLVRILLNFMFIGCALIFLSTRKPWLLWQSAISITFCHALIDYVEDLGPENELETGLWFMVIFVVCALFVASYLVSVFERSNNIVRNMLFLITWSCMLVAYLKLLSNKTVLHPQPGDAGVWSRIGDVVVEHLPVHAIFTVSAVYITYVALKMSRLAIKRNHIPR